MMNDINVRFDVSVKGVCIEQLSRWLQRVEVRKLESIVVLGLRFC